jgi:hypothetical protein
MTLGEIEIQHMRIEIKENSKQEPNVTVSATTVTGDKFQLKENPDDQEEVTKQEPLVEFVTRTYNETKAKLAETKSA